MLGSAPSNRHLFLLKMISHLSWSPYSRSAIVRRVSRGITLIVWRTAVTFFSRFRKSKRPMPAPSGWRLLAFRAGPSIGLTCFGLKRADPASWRVTA